MKREDPDHDDPLPDDIEREVLAEVEVGRFAWVDAALAEAWRALKRRGQGPTSGQGLIGALRDDAELLDQAVEHAMKVREERPLRADSGE